MLPWRKSHLSYWSHFKTSTSSLYEKKMAFTYDWGETRRKNHCWNKESRIFTLSMILPHSDLIRLWLLINRHKATCNLFVNLQYLKPKYSCSYHRSLTHLYGHVEPDRGLGPTHTANQLMWPFLQQAATRYKKNESLPRTIIHHLTSQG